MVHAAIVNDPKYVHVTVWIAKDRRIEWWPGTGRWSTDGSKSPEYRGNFPAFLAWLKEEVQP
ncbi:MAG: hypothetical protein AAGI34_06005 [Pseudomonadota bacterium]